MLLSKELFFVQYHYYLFLTLLLLYKIGSLEIQKAFLSLHSFQINTMKLLFLLQGD